MAFVQKTMSGANRKDRVSYGLNHVIKLLDEF